MMKSNTQKRSAAAAAVATAAAAAVLLSITLSACAGPSSQPSNGDSGTEQPIGGDVIAPVTMSVNELQGADIELLIGQTLNISTDSLAVDSYEGKIADPKVAEFVAGRNDGSAEFNPGVLAIAEGATKVIMTNEQGGTQPLEFTVRVVPR